MKIRDVELFRVRANGLGVLPKGYSEGTIVGLTESEVKSLRANPTLVQCFESIKIVSPFNQEDLDDSATQKKDESPVVREEPRDREVNRVHDFRPVGGRGNADGSDGSVQQAPGLRGGPNHFGLNSPGKPRKGR